MKHDNINFFVQKANKTFLYQALISDCSGSHVNECFPWFADESLHNWFFMKATGIA